MLRDFPVIFHHRKIASRILVLRSRALIFVLLIAALFLAACGSPQAVETPEPPPAAITPGLVRSGTGDTLRILNPQAPTTLNPHLSASAKDLDPARIVYEPLASFDKDGNLVPILAAEIPSIEDGGVASDGKSVTWKLRQGVKWSDGEPFSANDVVFTYEYVTNPDVKAITANTYSSVEKVEALDPNTVKVTFKNPTPVWFLQFVGARGMILPRHIFEPFMGPDAQKAPANILPVGTGPYRVVEPGIKPQEVLLLGSTLVETNKTVFEPNPFFRETDALPFSKIEWRGGATPQETARQLENDEVDIAYGIGQLPQEVLQPLIEANMITTNFGANAYRVLLNRTDPNQETIEGERSNLQFPHPFFSDPLVRQAFAHAIDRDSLAQLYGPAGRPISNNLVAPPRYASPNSFYSYDLEKAKALLDEAGWVDSNGDGFRDKDGEKLKVVFQAETGAALAQAQRIIKTSLEEIGVEVELKIVPSSVMFGPCAANPDSAWCFNADMQYVAINSPNPDPSLYMQYWLCSQIPQKANNWSTPLNLERWCSQEYDALFARSATELDPEARRQLFIQMNDLQVEDVVMIPTVLYAAVLGINPQLTDVILTPWDRDTWNIKDWRRTTP